MMPMLKPKTFSNIIKNSKLSPLWKKMSIFAWYNQSSEMSASEAVYPLDPEKVYFSMDELTLETDEGPKTLKVGAWLNYDPVRIHKMITREKTLKVDQIEVFNPLMSKLRRADQNYYKQIMGLNVTIDFPGFATDIVAKIPFENDPIGFYKWWRKGKHEEKVYLSKVNQFRLFQKVSLMEPKVMLKKDLEFLSSF
jgi:hypothetical protein